MKRQRLWVLAGVVAVVGLATYLLLTLPAWAYISSTTHTTYEDFNPGSFYLTGVLNQQGGEVALMSIGLAGVWTTPPITGLMPVFGHASVEHNGYVYVIGGQVGVDGGAAVLTRSVYFAQVNTLTHSLKPFTRTTELPEWLYGGGVYKHAAVVVGDYLYVVGGDDATPTQAPTDIVVYAKIKPDGTLSGTLTTTWNEATFLPAPRGRAPVVEMNGFLYVLGGQDFIGGDSVTDTVWYAQPDPTTGDIAEWFTATARLPKAVYGPMAATFDRIDYPDLLYVIGGYYISPSASIEGPIREVYFTAPSTATGDIQAGSWISTVIMENNILAGTAMEINGQLILVGGWKDYPAGSIISNTNAALLDIYTGQIITFDLGGGNVVGWFSAPAISPARYYHTAVVGPDQYVYVLGGTDGADGIPLDENILCVGATSGVAGSAGYAPVGWYVGPEIDLGRNIRPLFFEWTSFLPTTDVQLRLRHRLRSMQGVWSGWSSGLAPASPTGMVTTTVPFTQTGLGFQYLVQMTTTKSFSYTPVFHRFKLEYDVVEPPQFWKKANPSSGEGVLQGQLITYTILFTNSNAQSNITAATIEDLLPAGLVYKNLLAVTPGLSVVYHPQSQSLTCNIGTFMAGTTGQISFLAMVSPTATGNLTNTVKFRSFEADANAYTYHYVSQLLSPVLTKTADPPSGERVWGGRQLSYTLTFSNPNNITLDHVVITDRVPANTVLAAGSCQPACAVSGDELRWELPTLEPLGVGHVQFEAEVAETVVSGTQILNRGYIVGGVSGANARTSIAASNAVTHTVMDWLVILDKWASPPSGAQVTTGRLIDYTLIYTNNGDAPLQNVQVSDALPAELQWVSGSCSPVCQVVGGKDLVWTLSTVNPGQGGQLYFTAQVVGGVDGTLITNRAKFDFGTGFMWSNETKHLLVVPYDLVITKSDGVRRAEAGQVLTYTVAYTHLVPQGVVTLTNVIVTDDVLTPATLDLVSTQGWQVVSSTRLVLNVGTLAPNQSGRANLVMRVVNPLPGDPVLSARNQIRIGHDKKGQGDWNTRNETYVDSDALRGPDLEIRNLRAPAHVYKDTPMNIQFEVANEGLAAATAWDDDGTNNRWMMVELYAKPAGFTPAGPPSGPKDHVGGLCPDLACVSPRPQADYLRFIFPPVYPLDSVQFTSLSFAPVFTQLGSYELYLQVDVANTVDPDYGRVLEADEYNNIVYVDTVEVEPAKTCLPIVFKNWEGSNKIYLPIVLKKYS